MTATRRAATHRDAIEISLRGPHLGEAMTQQQCAYCDRPAIIYRLKICLRRRDQAISSPFQHVATAITAADDDEVFRNELSIMAGSFGESAKGAERLQPAMRGIRGNRATLARMVLGAKPVERYSMGGVYLGLCYAVAVVPGAQERVMRRIVRGLYWHHFESRLADDTYIEIVFIDKRKPRWDTDYRR